MKTVIHPASIAQIIPRLDTGGAELATLEMTRAIVRAGGRAFVLSEGGRLSKEIERAGGQFVPFPAGAKNPLRMTLNARLLAKFVRKTGVDVLHARSRAPAWSALWAARTTGTPFVTTYHGAYANRGPFKQLYNSVMARGDIVIANSKFTAQLIQERHGTAPERIRVIYRGVDLERFDPAKVTPERVSKMRKAWGAGERDRVVLHAARLTGWKGQRDVVDAALKLQSGPAGACVMFILAGDAQGRAEYAADLERRVAAAGLEGIVRLTGHCDDMPAAFLAAHVALVASTEPEAFGRTSAEAQAMGCPVIVTRQGASPETLLTARRDGADRATGWIVPASAPGALANAIAEVLHLSARERRELAVRARRHIAENFTSERMQRETLAVYDECLCSALVAAFDDNE